MSYLYVKSPQKSPPKIANRRRPFAVVFFALGFFLFTSALIPIIRFQLEYSVKFDQLINPLSSRFYNRSGNILGDVATDFTQLSNWFSTTDSSAGQTLHTVASGSYLLSIPSLKIIDANVEIGSLDLKKNLIQYPQTALPGQMGNSVIFGHSVLPQFFNPKSYLTIFSTLHRLRQGDEILVNYDNIRYRYLVEDMYEVKATDLSVLEQRFDGRYLTLITCSPPGTYIRRLVVKARIVDS